MVIFVNFYQQKKKLKKNTPEAKNIDKYIQNYFSGKKSVVTLKVKPSGTKFQRKVWKEIIKIKYGELKTYHDISVALSSSPIAVGNACSKNPCLIIIPCHRVIKKNRTYGNYALGISLKKFLIDLERRSFWLFIIVKERQ